MALQMPHEKSGTHLDQMRQITAYGLRIRFPSPGSGFRFGLALFAAISRGGRRAIGLTGFVGAGKLTAFVGA